MIKYSDNRNFFRMMVNTEMTISINQEDSERTMSALCIDLSATGMAIELDEPIEVGTEVICTLDAGHNALKALTSVVRCDQLENGIYVLGVEIKEHL